MINLLWGGVKVNVTFAMKKLMIVIIFMLFFVKV